MIRTEKEYQECCRKLERDLQVIEQHKEKLKSQGFTVAEIEIALEPAFCFYKQLEEERIWYERVLRREFGSVESLTDIGKILIALRIANRMSQKQLAERLGVDESQISRDERNEYHGMTLERAQRIFDAMEEKLVVNLVDKSTFREPIRA